MIHSVMKGETVRIIHPSDIWRKMVLRSFLLRDGVSVPFFIGAGICQFLTDHKQNFLFVNL